MADGTLLGKPAAWLVSVNGGIPFGTRNTALVEHLLKTPGAKVVPLVTQEDAEREIKHWKSNHDNMVSKAALLSQRPDLPVDRIPAVRELDRLQAREYHLAIECQTLRHGLRLKDRYVEQILTERDEALRELEKLQGN
jgi:hypothetical protein